jgi:NAD(P)-dependent dehydrogenase (short-subunit alcohol dehydrogenase family)
MVDADEFSGRSALITGGTRGIGKGIADRLRAGGAKVLVAARSVPDGESHDVIAADVSTADGVAALGAEALDRLGSIDILVHNVGGSGQYEGGAAGLTDEDCPARPGDHPRNDHARFGGFRTHHVDPAPHASAHLHPVRGGQGRIDQLQQGVVERVGA